MHVLALQLMYLLPPPAPVTVSFGEIEYNFVENEVTGTIRVVTSRPSPVDFSFTVTARTLSYI